jgi:hypothetical protein
MLYARRRGLRHTRYTITRDRQRLTVWTPLVKGEGGRFELDGVDYEVDTGGPAEYAVLSVAGGPPVAVAEGVGRTQWSVRVAYRRYSFERAQLPWTQELLAANGRPVGFVRRAGRRVEAQLPGVDPPVAVFVLAVVITMWSEAGSARSVAR